MGKAPDWLPLADVNIHILLFWREEYVTCPWYQVFEMEQKSSDSSLLEWWQVCWGVLFLEEQIREHTWVVYKEAAGTLQTSSDYLFGFVCCSSVENGRPPDPADWAVIDVVNYFRTAGFEEQASAFQEQVSLLGNTLIAATFSHCAFLPWAQWYLVKWKNPTLGDWVWKPVGVEDCHVTGST